MNENANMYHKMQYMVYG